MQSGGLAGKRKRKKAHNNGSEQSMNWNRISANAGLAFFTSLAANLATGSTTAFETSIILAIIMAGLAFFSEMKLETEQEGRTLSRVQQIVTAGLLV